MRSQRYDAELSASICAVARACRLTEAVANDAQSPSSLSYVSKTDLSPVTVGDFGAQALIISHLRSEFSDAKFIAEESSAALVADATLMERVRMYVNKYRVKGEGSKMEMEALSPEDIAQIIDAGSGKGESGQKSFVLDPIDGTKGFVNGRQYCIALGLVEDGGVRVGVLGCPRLPSNLLAGGPNGKSGYIFYAVEGGGTWMVGVDEAEDGKKGVQVHVSSEQDAGLSVFAESVEQGHSSHELSARIANILNVSSPPVRMDSQAKYGCMARGDFSIFMRFPRGGYVENIWDHAAGSIIIEEAGGRVTDGRGQQLNFGKGRKLDNADGIVATNGTIHDAVIAAVQEALQEAAV